MYTYNYLLVCTTVSHKLNIKLHTTTNTNINPWTLFTGIYKILLPTKSRATLDKTIGSTAVT